MIGARIAELRRLRGMTQAELAHLIHAHNSFVSRWENSSHLPSAIHLIALADALSCTTDQLLGRAPLDGAE